MATNNTIKKRLDWMDLLRCFAIFTVVIGHLLSIPAFATESGEQFYRNIIVPFHMPLFVMLSGWFFSGKDDVKTFFTKKALSIALPYTVWVFIYYFLILMCQSLFSPEGFHLSTLVWHVRFAIDAFGLYGWWFLRGLFFCFLVAYPSIKLFKDNYLWCGIFSIVMMFVLSLSGIIPNHEVKDSVFKGFIYLYPFFWVGALAKRYIDKLANMKTLIAMGVLFVGMLLGWHGEPDSFYGMNTSALAPGNAANPLEGWDVVIRTLYRFVTGVAGGMFFVLLFKHIFDNDAVQPVTESPFRKWCKSVGKNTLGIYILQSFVYWNLPKHDLFGMGDACGFVISLIVSTLVIIVSQYIIVITSKSSLLALALWGKLKK